MRQVSLRLMSGVWGSDPAHCLDTHPCSAGKKGETADQVGRGKACQSQTQGDSITSSLILEEIQIKPQQGVSVDSPILGPVLTQ
jgi:hypothetical protein